MSCPSPTNASTCSRDSRWLSARVLSTFNVNIWTWQEHTYAVTHSLIVLQVYYTSCRTGCFSSVEAFGLLAGSSCRQSSMKALCDSGTWPRACWMASLLTRVRRPSELPRRSKFSIYVQETYQVGKGLSVMCMDCHASSNIIQSRKTPKWFLLCSLYVSPPVYISQKRRYQQQLSLQQWRAQERHSGDGLSPRSLSWRAHGWHLVTLQVHMCTHTHIIV